MDYFDDLNPYLVKEEEMPTRQETPTPPAQPAEQTYVENILRVNVGKKGTFYFSYTGSKAWNDKIYMAPGCCAAWHIRFPDRG